MFNYMKKYDYVIELLKKHSLTHIAIACVLLAVGGILANFKSPIGDYIMITGAVILAGYTVVGVLHAFIINPIRNFLNGR